MFLFILNPVAGNGRAVKIFDSVSPLFKEAGYDFDVVRTQYPGHASQLASEAAASGYDNIVAVGGDGTVLEVATGLAGHTCNFGIIPAGTGNDFVNSLGITNDPAYAAQVIMDNCLKPVDVGMTSQNRYFINVAGTGFDVEVIRFTEKLKKVLRGMAAYLVAALCSILTYKAKTLTFTTENGTFEQAVLLVAIANGRTYGGGMKVAPNAMCDDGYFDVTIIDSVPRYVIPTLMPKFISGKHEEIKQLKTFRCKTIEIKTSEPCPINMDGEIIGDTPMRFEVKHNQLMMFSPRTLADTGEALPSVSNA